VRNTKFKNNRFDYLRDSDGLTLKNNTYAGNSFDKDELPEGDPDYLSIYGYVKDVDLFHQTILVDEVVYVSASDRVMMKKYGVKSIKGNYAYFNPEENWVSYSLSEAFAGSVWLNHYIDGKTAYWSEDTNLNALASSLEYTNDQRVFSLYGEDNEIFSIDEATTLSSAEYVSVSEQDAWLSLREDGRIDTDDFVFVYQGDRELMEQYGYTDADFKTVDYISANEEPAWYYCTLYDYTLYTVIDWAEDEDGIPWPVWRTTSDYNIFLEYYDASHFYHVVYTDYPNDDARALSITQIYVP
jgi:hypothetical protein